MTSGCELRRTVRNRVAIESDRAPVPVAARLARLLEEIWLTTVGVRRANSLEICVAVVLRRWRADHRGRANSLDGRNVARGSDVNDEPGALHLRTEDLDSRGFETSHDLDTLQRGGGVRQVLRGREVNIAFEGGRQSRGKFGRRCRELSRRIGAHDNRLRRVVRRRGCNRGGALLRVHSNRHCDRGGNEERPGNNDARWIATSATEHSGEERLHKRFSRAFSRRCSDCSSAQTQPK